jgi:glucose-1-phosphate adenylyltransferase
MRDVLVVILGGGQGSRLFPLTHMRSKPAVPIGAKYRLIDVPISNCLHVELRRIFVLTQFNSASLNRHIAQTYRLDLFSSGFVEILAAEQTPENQNWFQGTADAVRRAMRHFSAFEASYYLILAGDHLFRMDFSRLIEAHVDTRADVTIAAQPVTPDDATQMGIFRFDGDGQIEGFEEKPSAARLAEMGSSQPGGASFVQQDPDKPFVASMGIYVFSRDVLFEVLHRYGYVDFGKEVIPASLARHRVRPYLFRGYWADVGTISSFYDANISLTRRGAPFNFFDPSRPIYTRPRFLPASRFHGCSVEASLVAEGCYLDGCAVQESVVGLRTRIDRGTRVTRSVLLGADYYESEEEAPGRDSDQPALGIGRDVVLDRVIVDKNARIGDGARLVNQRGVDHADGPGYFIRNGIIIVPKGGSVAPGTIA